MKENKEIIKKKSYKIYLVILTILTIAIFITWFGLDFVSKTNVNEINKSDNLDAVQDEYQNKIFEDNNPLEQKQDDIESIKISEENNKKLIEPEILYSDLLQITLDLYSKRDCSELINKLNNNLCNANCSKEIQNSILFLKEINDNRDQKSTLVLPKNDKFLHKILASVIRIEKIDSVQIKSRDYISKHIELIKNYINQLQASYKND